MDKELKDKYSSLINLVIYKIEPDTVIKEALPIWNKLMSELKQNPNLFSQKEMDVLHKVSTILQKQVSNQVASLAELNFDIPKTTIQEDKKTSDKSEKIFAFGTFKEALEFGKLWANEFFDVKTTRRFKHEVEVAIRLRNSTKLNKPSDLNKTTVKTDPKLFTFSESPTNKYESPTEYVKSHNNKITSFSVAADTPIHLQCFKCKYEESAFKVMGSEDQLNKDDKKQNTKLQYIKKVLPKLKCQKCSSTLLLLIPKEINTKIIYVATNSTRNNKFHKSTCGWMSNVPAGSEIRFKSREDAIKTGFAPCASCKP
jgi:hypothetical protein